MWPLYVQKKHPKLERYRQVILNHSCRYSTFDPGGRECWCSNCWHVAAGRAMQTQKRTRSRKCHLPHRAVRSDPMEKMSVQQLCVPLVTLGFWDLHAVGRAAEASLDATESMAKTKSTPPQGDDNQPGVSNSPCVPRNSTMGPCWLPCASCAERTHPHLFIQSRPCLSSPKWTLGSSCCLQPAREILGLGGYYGRPNGSS